MAYNIVSNRLLSNLSPLVQASLLPMCEAVALERGVTLAHSGQSTEHVYFVESGFISVIGGEANDGGVEIGLIGREGMLGTWLALGRDAAPFQVMVQGAGMALRMPAAQFRDVCATYPELAKAVLAYAQDLSDMIAETCLANTRLTLEKRLVRWILLADDRESTDKLLMTHDLLSKMLGVRRAGVTMALHVLEGEHLLRSTRGAISILNRHKLEAAVEGFYRPDRSLNARARPQPARENALLRAGSTTGMARLEALPR